MKKLRSKLKLIKILSPVFKMLIFACWIFPIRKEKVLLWNFAGEKPGDTPLYLDKYISEANSSYDLYWIIKKENLTDKFHKDSRHHYVKKYSLGYFYHIATAGIWILNSRSDPYFIKRKRQFYLQTWHSPLRLKKIEADAEEYLEKDYVEKAKRDAGMTDLMICGNDFSKNTYENSFYYSGRVELTGTPRVDVLFSQKNKDMARKKIANHYNFSAKKKIVLYAPTFRRKSVDYSWVLDLARLKEELGNNYIIIARAHPRSTIPIPKDTIDATKYSDIQDLILACDVLITDYSGCCFDAMYATKKCILYVPDKKEYEKSERSTYFKTDDLPFSICENEEDVYEEVRAPIDEKYRKRIALFLNEIGDHETGNASKKVYELLMKYEKI